MPPTIAMSKQSKAHCEVCKGGLGCAVGEALEKMENLCKILDAPSLQPFQLCLCGNQAGRAAEVVERYRLALLAWYFMSARGDLARCWFLLNYIPKEFLNPDGIMPVRMIRACMADCLKRDCKLNTYVRKFESWFRDIGPEVRPAEALVRTRARSDSVEPL